VVAGVSWTTPASLGGTEEPTLRPSTRPGHHRGARRALLRADVRDAGTVGPSLAVKGDASAAGAAPTGEPEAHRQIPHFGILPARVVGRRAFHFATSSAFGFSRYRTGAGTHIAPEMDPFAFFGAGVGP
jgi:hypothetical protein